ncbi:hypothetical protein Bhyg_08262, partial [Pseudolycoriella hygida]
MNFILSTMLIAIHSFKCVASQKGISGFNHETKFEFNCSSILSSMNFFYNHRCVQVIVGHDLDSTECIKETMTTSNNVTFFVRSLSWLLNRNIFVDESVPNVAKKKSTRFCGHFLIILKNVFSLQPFLSCVQNNATFLTFFPFSKLYFMFVEKKYRLVEPQTWKEISNFFYTNYQFGFAYEFDATTKDVKLRDFLTLNRTHGHKIKSNLFHPFVNRRDNRKEFRLSFYNCSPFIIYVDEDNFSFNGIEYQLVREITKNWKIRYILRDESKTGISPWITMFDDLKNRTADIAMCSIWISVFDDKYDVSGYYNHECNTLLIPKPKRLSEMTAIYKSLSGKVWLTFGLLFSATGFLLWSTAMVGIGDRSAYVSLSRTFLEIMNIATLHGVNTLRQQQISVKILLMSWIIVCSLFGICYTTVYTSRLSKPGYTKVIDTIEDFIENGMKCFTFEMLNFGFKHFIDMLWGSHHSYADFQSSLSASSNPAYHELNRRIVVFQNNDEAKAALASGKFGVYAGLSNDKYFVTYDWNEQLNLLSSFRLMRKACIFNYYTVFALQKFSPYTEIFSHYALQFQEHGITQFWFSKVYRDKVWLNKFLENYPKENNEPTVLRFVGISGILLLLFVGHILSTVVFTYEIIFHNRNYN